jgi:hypothetical protein
MAPATAEVKRCEVCGANPAKIDRGITPSINGRSSVGICAACLRKLPLKKIWEITRRSARAAEP